MDPAKKERLIEAIKGRIEDEKSAVQHTAVRAMSLMTETVEISVPLLVETAIEGDKQERLRALENLVAVGEGAIDEVIDKMVNHPTDQDARLQGINVLMTIYENDKAQGGDQESTCARNEDPHGLGPIFRKALISVFREVLEGKDEPPKEEE